MNIKAQGEWKSLDEIKRISGSIVERAGKTQRYR